MTVQVKEIIESRTRRRTGDKVQMIRQYKVFDDVSTNTFTSLQARAAPDLPDNSSPHPEDPTFRAMTEPTIRAIPERSYTWLVDVMYEQTGLAVPTERELDTDAIGYTEINVNQRREFVPTYRVQVIAPSTDEVDHPLRTNTNSAPNNVDDVGGFPIDAAGKPEDRPVYIQEAEITVVIKGVPDFATYGRYTNSRNSGQYLGAPAGKLVYIGARSTRIGENKWRVVHRMAFDDFYHLRQIPYRLADGKVQLLSSGWTTVYSSQQFEAGTIAFPVWHVQPYPITRAFSALGIKL